MAEYRYYLIPDFMSHVFPQQFEEQAPTEFFSNTADLMKRYQQLREMPYNNEYTWNERTNLPYPRLTVGIDRRDPDGAVTIIQVRNKGTCWQRHPHNRVGQCTGALQRTSIFTVSEPRWAAVVSGAQRSAHY